MTEEKEIPEGFYWKPADPVDYMYVGDKGITKHGQVVTLMATYYPQQQNLIFRVDETGETIDLPLSQASSFITPNKNRGEGRGSLAMIDEKAP